MKAAVITVRIILGALFLFSSVAYFLNLIPPGEMSQGAQQFFTGMVASKYLLPVVKVIELLVGVALLAGRFVPLATVHRIARQHRNPGRRQTPAGTVPLFLPLHGARW